MAVLQLYQLAHADADTANAVAATATIATTEGADGLSPCPAGGSFWSLDRFHEIGIVSTAEAAEAAAAAAAKAAKAAARAAAKAAVAASSAPPQVDHPEAPAAPAPPRATRTAVELANLQQQLDALSEGSHNAKKRRKLKVRIGQLETELPAPAAIVRDQTPAHDTGPLGDGATAHPGDAAPSGDAVVELVLQPAAVEDSWEGKVAPSSFPADRAVAVAVPLFCSRPDYDGMFTVPGSKGGDHGDGDDDGEVADAHAEYFRRCRCFSFPGVVYGCDPFTQEVWTSLHAAAPSPHSYVVPPGGPGSGEKKKKGTWHPRNRVDKSTPGPTRSR